jgi:predicted HNH restriction endonuclease
MCGPFFLVEMIMPYKDPIIRAAKSKTYNLTWYEENKERHKANAKDTRKRNRDLWNEYKASLKCAQCGFSHPGAIDFHHTDSATKEGEVSRLAGVGSYKKAYAEIEKCIPLCSNCHRILHWDEHRA